MATEQTWVPLTEQERKALQTGAEGRRELDFEGNSAFVAANSHEVEMLRAEIVEVGRKLWER